MQRVLLLISSVLLTALLGTSGSAESAASVQLSPWGFVHPPAHMEIIAHIDRNAANRRATVVLSADGIPYSASEVQLDGENSPFLVRREFNRMPVGNYQAFLELTRWEGGKWRVLSFKSKVLQVVD